MTTVDRPYLAFDAEPAADPAPRARPLPIVPEQKHSFSDRHRDTPVTMAFVEGYCLNPPALPPLRPRVVLEPAHFINVVCNAYEITPEQLFAKKRTRLFSEARAVCIWLMRSGSTMSMTAVGEAMHRPDHTSVIWGVRQCERMRSASEKFREFTDRLLAEAKGERR